MRRQVSGLLGQETTGLDQADLHDYADWLEELLPFIADEQYLSTRLAFELARTDDVEERKRSDLFDQERIVRLRAISATSGPPAGVDPDCRRREMAAALSLLARERADWLRHDRLVRSLRARYVIWFGAILVLLLAAVVIFAAPQGGSDAGDVRRSLVLVMVMGALGSVVAALLAVRDVFTVVSFRQAARMIWLQPLVGASFGLLSWFVLTAGILKISESTVTDWRACATIAFGAGCSEPFALGIVKRVSGL